MNRTPENYYDSAFTLAETAAIAGVTELEFRTRIARGDSPAVGLRRAGRLYFTTHDAYALALASAMVAHGVAPRLASEAAWSLSGGDNGDAPDPFTVASVTNRGGDVDVKLLDKGDVSEIADATILLPLRPIWESVTDRANATWARGEA